MLGEEQKTVCKMVGPLGVGCRRVRGWEKGRIQMMTDLEITFLICGLCVSKKEGANEEN